MDDIDKLVEAEIQHIRQRLRLIASDIIDMCNGEAPKNIDMFDAAILREIADGFEDEIGPTERPVLKVVPKRNDD